MSDNVAAQGEHLPDCFLGQPCRSNGGKEHVMQNTVAGFPVTICGLCMYDCICPALRACEDRVRMETQLECRLTPDDWRDAAEQAYAKGRADERAELWRLLAPLVTEMAMRNAGASA